MWISRPATAALATLVAAAVLAGGPRPARADVWDEGGALYAVQNRKHLVSHEFTAAAGVVPLDAFYKGVTATFAYAYHFSDLWAWEIANGTYSFNFDTNLRNDLETNFGVQPTEFPELRMLASSSVVVKPLYGKLAFLNGGLVYLEMFANAGPAIAEYENAGISVGFDVGVGFRVHLSRYFAFRIDLRNYGFVDVAGLKDFRFEFHPRAGISLNIP